ncbi:MAG: peroxide stress protein YaaA [Chromatiales bacterium]|jgi:cytoplasmic iron level regulating protein YaaA (DUF328/UPF0246 family)
MLIVISPAKTLDYETPPVTRTHTKPELLHQSQRLINILRNYSALDLAELMHLSMKLAELNFERYHAWKTPFNLKNAKQAALAMKGDVYTGLDAESLGEEDLAFAQEHLRILSGLYGVLRPLDLMQAYRLEMGTKLPNEQGKDLYAFWGDSITRTLNKAMVKQGDDILVNLASNEYFKSVKPKLLKGRIITPQFKEYRNGAYKMIGIFAKQARGLMSRYIIQNRLHEPERLKAFDLEGYAFDEELSKDSEWVFTRSAAAVSG